jgi:hypothetical protein
MDALELQYDLFEDNDELSLLQKQVMRLAQSNEKVRKGLFARLNRLGLEYAKALDKLHELELRLQLMEKNL